MIIQLDNKAFDLRDFLAFCKNEVETNKGKSWRDSIYQFFIDWHNDNESVEVQTSGSTGEAKTISLLKKHMVVSAQATIQFLNIEPNEWAWLCLSADFIAGKMMIVRALTGQMNLWISKPDALTQLPALDSIGLTAVVPMQLTPWIEDPFNAGNLEKKITHLLVGGTSISASLEKKLQQMSPIAIWHTYGMTETISHVALRRINGPKRSDVYGTLTGIILSQNSQGCLVIEYPQIGVTNLHTHDLVKLASDNTFLLEGRSDWMINSGGIKINPLNAERALEDKLPGAFIITWLPDPILGQKAILCIENDGSLLQETCSIWKNIEANYHENKFIREIHFLDKFTRSENGKIRREPTRLLLIEMLG